MIEGFGTARLEIKFDVDQPIELVQLTLALQAMGRDYRRFANDSVRAGGGKVSDEDIRLYVTRVQSGSVLAEMASAAPVMGAFLQVIDYQTLFANYVQFFGSTVEYFRGLSKRTDLKASDIECTKAGANAIADMMAVAVAQKGGSLHTCAGSRTAAGDEVYAEVHITHEQAAEAQRGALIASRCSIIAAMPITKTCYCIFSGLALQLRF